MSEPAAVPHAEYARMKTHLYHRIETLKARAEAAEAELSATAQASRMGSSLLRERVQKRLALIEAGGYSIVEMAVDLEHLANHPVWAQAEQATVEAERAADVACRAPGYVCPLDCSGACEWTEP